jgi:zinc transport system permease protein
MEALFDLFRYEFMVRAFIAGLMIAVVTPLIGGFLVVRQMSIMADALAHVALAGVALGLFMGADPITTTLITTVVVAVLIEYLRKNGSTSSDALLAMLQPGGLAVSLVLVSLANGFNASLSNYLFGSITAVNTNDLWIMGGLCVVIIATIIGLYRTMLYTAFDEVSARASGLPVFMLNSILMVLTALTVSIALRTIGGLLVGALMIIPVSTAMLFARGFKQSLLYGIGIAVGVVMVGLVASYHLDLPSGATIVLVSLIIYFCTRIVFSAKR